jgi:hypothetical protein
MTVWRRMRYVNSYGGWYNGEPNELSGRVIGCATIRRKDAYKTSSKQWSKSN